MTKDWKRRLTAAEALQHEWLTIDLSNINISSPLEKIKEEAFYPKQINSEQRVLPRLQSLLVDSSIQREPIMMQSKAGSGS